MSFGLVQTIILLLPGYLALWVFHGIVQENTEKRPQHTQLAFALLLGLSSIFVYYLACRALGAEFYFRKSWEQIPFSESRFWWAYMWLCGIALLLGLIVGVFREEQGLPTQWLSWLGSRSLGRGLKCPCENSLRRLVDSLGIRKEADRPLVRVFRIGEGRDKALYGFWDGFSESGQDFFLTFVQLCDVTPDMDKYFRLQRRKCWANHQSGIVIEFIDGAGTFNEGMREVLVENFKDAANAAADADEATISSSGG